VQRRRLDTVACLEGELLVPVSLWAGVANALASAVAELAEGHGALARIGIVAGEPPVLTVFGPRRDIVAGQVRDALTAGATHRRPTVWLTLPAGVYLASVIDPGAPFAAPPEVLAEVVAAGKARHAVATEAVPHSGGVALRVAIYSTLGGVRLALSLARKALASLPG
jgi:hypothetical protein